MHRFGILALWLGGLGFLGFGMAFLLAPLQTFALAGLDLQGPVAATEVMAFYGGLEIALGGLIVACAMRRARRADGLLLMATAYGGIGLARLVGMFANGADSSFLRIALGLELGLAALAIAVLLSSRRR
jgi:hypothetical protein